MKKFFSGIKNNIFYISLIAGMAVLVTVVALYNAKTNSNDDRFAALTDTSEDTTDSAQETLSGKDKSNLDTEADTATTAEKKQATTEAAAESEMSGGAQATDTAGKSDEAETSGASELHYNPADTISWPVSGNVIIPYSMDTTVYFETLSEYKCSPAMVIEAEEGAEVKAVYDCEVTEVSSSPELGNYVKLSLGDGYTVTLGQLGEVKAALGDRLSAGDVVGTVGQPSRFYTEEGTNLYFAIAKDGEPVDPTLLMQ